MYMHLKPAQKSWLIKTHICIIGPYDNFKVVFKNIYMLL